MGPRGSIFGGELLRPSMGTIFFFFLGGGGVGGSSLFVEDPYGVSLWKFI